MITANLDFQSTNDTHIVVCNETMPCASDLVTDCLEVDKNCIIDCTNPGTSICKDAEFICHPNKDCTLICDSTNTSNACRGTILNASLSNNININIECINLRSCEYLTIDTISSNNINLNITVYDKTNAEYPQFISKHSKIYLPQSGNTYINCIGHSSCHSMSIYGNTSQISSLNIKNIGQHSFKDSYVSFPSNTDINILCNNTESCFASKFDGSSSGINSDINIKCNGNNACFGSLIIANNKSKSLMVNGVYGNKVLSDTNIICPEDNCKIIVHNNAMNMLINAHIYSNNKVIIECDNCIEHQNQTAHIGPILYCYNHINESCDLIMQNNQFKCLNNQTISCLQYNLSNDSRFDAFETTFVLDNNINIHNNNHGLMHNVKGQIVLATIILILLSLCILVCIVKKRSIKQFLQNPFAMDDDSNDFIQGVTINQYDVMRIPDYNNHYNVGNKNKNKYEVLEESYSMNDENDIVMISDPTDDEDQFEH